MKQAKWNKNEFAQALVELGFIQGGEKYNPDYQLEVALQMPKLNLLWQILLKTQPTTAVSLSTYKARKNDILKIMAAILNLQSDEMVDTKGHHLTRTQNPLLYRNYKQDLVFDSHADIEKFSVKFKNFREQYFQNLQKKQVQEKRSESSS